MPVLHHSLHRGAKEYSNQA